MQDLWRLQKCNSVKTLMISTSNMPRSTIKILHVPKAICAWNETRPLSSIMSILLNTVIN
uniref:Uncharacterized protein n=1 Tax=Octopus bimaculoides TaxID=37653 RepID=A0A0L8H9X3_OCTBM